MALLAGLAAALITAAPVPAPAPGSAPAPAAAAAPADPARVRELASRILKDREYQRELPGPEAPPATIPLRLAWLGTLVRVLSYGAAIALLALGVAWLVRRLRPAARDVDVVPAAPTAAPVELPTASAEALAAAGRYGPAIHALLLDTLAALSRAARLPAALTSREIVARVALPGEARDALAGLVVAVEVSWFGGAEPGEAEYRACLDRFHAFRSAYRRAA